MRKFRKKTFIFARESNILKWLDGLIANDIRIHKIALNGL